VLDDAAAPACNGFANQLVMVPEELLPMEVAVVFEVARRIDDVGEDERHRDAPADVTTKERVDTLGVDASPELIEDGARAAQLVHRAFLVAELRVRTGEKDPRPRRLVASVRLLPAAQRLSEGLHCAGGVAARKRHGAGGKACGRVQSDGVVAVRHLTQVTHRGSRLVDGGGSHRDLHERR
jgi:hypothetical protein